MPVASAGQACALPILRWGTPYQSLDVVEVVGCDGQSVGEVSLANVGLIRRDLLAAEATARSVR